MTESDRIHVTEAESEVLSVLWRLGPLPPSRLIAEVKAGRAWADTTVKTLLSRLVQKGAVGAEREPGRTLYRPLVDREAYLGAEVQSLVERLFDDDPEKLMEHLRRVRRVRRLAAIRPGWSA